ncbi:hypothetical protein M9Y10_010588 [Tritrichomonas musculus]|uniref:Uncharacterized protein n=1 Tax=Tritrichomonas musculus TaxID=1915356 RepID=A0ABR2IMD6_9EUKA
MKRSRKPRVPACFSRTFVPERVVSMNLLDGFVAQGSRGEKLVEEMVGMPLENISKNGLCKLAVIVSHLIDIKLPRNIYRRKDLMVKWFQDNEDKINVYKPFICVKTIKQ